MVDTTALVGSARVGTARVGSLGDTPPPRLRVHGACWDLVTDPAAVEAAKVAAAGTRILDRAPTTEDGAGLPVGAGIIQQDPATGLMVAFWRWDGSQWQQSSLSGDAVTVTEQLVARVAQILQLDVAQLVVTEGASINQLVALAIAGATAEFQTAFIQNLRSNGAVIDEAVIGDLAANLITSGLFRTAVEGQRLEIDSNGLIMYGLDADGEEYEMVRLGPSGVNLLTVGRTQVAPDSVTSPQGMFDDLAVAGQPVADYVDARIRATGSQMVAIGGAGGAGNNIPVEANRKTGIFDLVLENIRHDAWYQATVDMTTFPRSASKAAELTMGLHHAPITMGVMYNSPILAERRSGPMSSTMWDHETLQFWFRGSQITSAPDGGAARLLLSALSDQRIDVNGDTTMVIEMIGPALPFSSTLNRGGTPLPGSTDTTVPPVSQVREYTKTYVATGSTTYYSTDNRVYSGSPDVIQGSYSGAASDRRHGAWWFPSMTGDLAGATIKSVSIEATANHTYIGSGGMARFLAHNGSNSGGGNIMNATFTAGQTRRMEIPSIHWDSLKNGTLKGFMVYTTSNHPNEYMRFNGGAGTARIHVTYEK